MIVCRLAVDNLVQLQHAQDARSNGNVATRVGFANELGTLMTITRLGCPSFFAIPAIIRADNGNYHKKATHDVRIIQQSWGTINSCIPYEVKTSDKPRDDDYDAALVRGKVELLMPSARDSLDLAVYMDQERKGIISSDHARELNEVTSRVLKLALEYKRRTYGAAALVGAAA